MTKKECVRCEVTKPIEQFETVNGYRRSTCKQCRTEQRRDWDLSYREKLLAETPYFPNVQRITLGGIAI